MIQEINEVIVAVPVSVWQHWPPPWWSKDRRWAPDQLGIVIRQKHSPAYEEAPLERWDRTDATSTGEKTWNRRMV